MMEWNHVEYLPDSFEGFCWIVTDGKVELAFTYCYENNRKFQDPETVGDREGLSVEYFHNVTHYKEITKPPLQFRHASPDDNGKAINCPDFLQSPDGRRLRIRKWTPTLSVGKLVSVEIDAIIELPKENT